MTPKHILLFCILAVSLPAFAAPFCAVPYYSKGSKECSYFTYKDCMRAAGTKGECTTNDREVPGISGLAPFCVLTTQGTLCNYYDEVDCNRAAAVAAKHGDATCIVNPTK
jgi:hypothetical protein